MTIVWIVALVGLLYLIVEGDNIHWYVIKKGRHYAQLNINRLRIFSFRKSIEYRVMFDETSLYDTELYGDHINKLCGMTDVNSLVHSNSIRFGWRPNNRNLQIDLYAYWYDNGDRNFIFIDSVELHETHYLKLSIEKEQYRFQVENQILVIKRSKRGQFGLKMRLFPYFGGQPKAPRDIKIYLKQLS